MDWYDKARAQLEHELEDGIITPTQFRRMLQELDDEFDEERRWNDDVSY